MKDDVGSHAETGRRLEALTDLALALSDAQTLPQVAEVVVDRGMGMVAADACALYVRDGESAPRLAGQRGRQPELAELIRRAGSGALLLGEDERAAAFWSVPLVAQGRTVGLLGLAFAHARRFSPGDRAFVDAFTRQCAYALVCAARRTREDEARHLLSITLRSIGDAVIATDTQGRITFMNPVAAQLTGWREDEACGLPLEDVFRIHAGPTGDRLESPVARVLREGTVVGLASRTVLRSRGDREIPIEDSGAPIHDGDASGGRGLLGVVLVFRDASAQKRAQVRRDFLARAGEALGSSLDYRATLSTVAGLAVPELADWCVVDLVEPGTMQPRQVAVAHADPGRVSHARELGERYPPDPHAPIGVPAVIRSGRSELYAEIPPAMLEGAARDAEHLRAMRELRLESAMVVPLPGRDRTLGAMTFVYAGSGRRYGADDLAFAEDFARRAAMAIENARALKHAEEARARERLMRSEAETASRAKDQFLATVSHELRTPLNAIMGWTVTLRGRQPPAEIDRGLAVIERNARAQARLVEDVLDLSRIISGKLTLNLGPTRIAGALDAALEAVTPAAQAKGIAIAVRVADDLTILADADRVQQIAWNLLSNAVKFTPKGGAVSARAFPEGADVCITVTDTGEGIPEGALPFVFDPFHQADASTTRRHGGLGLGLTIVKQLVSAHGGTVSAESEGADRGATFTVRLPAAHLPQWAAGARSGAIAAPHPRPAMPERDAPRLDGLRLLVVDDDGDARDVMAEVLRGRGAEVFASASAADALEQLEAVRPDVIVSDIAMPEIDGYTLIRRIRSLPPERGGRTPAVALTAYSQTEDARRAFAAGYQVHVPKPVEPARLATLVANLGGRTLD
jgi:PAS domain S-box-containing protein